MSLAAACLAFFAVQEPADFSVKVVEIKGSADARPAADKPWEPLKAEAVLRKGAWVQTGLKSKVYLRFGDNTVVQLKSATLVQIDEALKQGDKLTGRLKLSLGNVEVNVNDQRKDKETVDFKVTTPQVTTSVKGTFYGVGYNTQFGSVIRVERGLVEADNRRVVREIRAGETRDARLLSDEEENRLARALALAVDALSEEMKLSSTIQYADSTDGSTSSFDTQTTSTSIMSLEGSSTRTSTEEVSTTPLAGDLK